MPRRTIFDVRPRFTAGSPAQVSEAEALRIAQSEQTAFAYGPALHGPEKIAMGLDGIVIAWREIGRTVEVHDLITGADYSFKSFTAFQEWHRNSALDTSVSV